MSGNDQNKFFAQSGFGRDSVKLFGQFPGFRRLADFIHDNQLALLKLVSQNRKQRFAPGGAVHFERPVAIIARSKRNAAVSPQWRTNRTGARPTSAFLLPRLFAAAGNLAHHFGVGPRAANAVAPRSA